jgi:pimeloyl-ACP methyl ester carboxylesterase
MECNLDGITVHYEAFGQGRPIILLHGWSLDHRHIVSDMEPLFQQREGWWRLYPDLPGHGRTPAQPSISTQDDMLDVVLALIDHVIPGRRFVVAGMSAGAYLARGVVHHRGEQVDGLLLTVPLIVPDDAQRDLPVPVTLVEDPALVSELQPQEAELLEIAVVQSRKCLQTMVTDIGPAMEAGDGEFLAKIRSDPARYGFSFEVDDLPEPFAGPTMIIAGRQDSAVGYRDAWRIVENYPRATFVVLDRAGHMLSVEQEGLFRALVSEWLDRVEEYAGP